jgi:putative ABC exporter
VSGAPGAFAFLFTRTIRNRLTAQARRLRSPRYVIAVAVACGYFVFLFENPSGGLFGLPGLAPTGGSGTGPSRVLQMLTACGLAAFAAKWWLIGGSDATLAFSPAELQFLFPAPVRRRDLILFKIWRMQLMLVVSALIVAALARHAGARLAPPLRVVALWVLFSTIALHQMAAALVRSGAGQRGAGLRRNVVAIGLVVAGGAVLLVVGLRAWPGARTMAEVPRALAAVGQALAAPVPAAVLWPFRIALAPSYAETPVAWLVAIGPAILLLALHTVWVLRADAVFEDAAVAASARRATRIAAMRARASGRPMPTTGLLERVSGSFAVVGGQYGSRRRPRAPSAGPARRLALPLAPLGDPAVAVVWKNTLALFRGWRVRTVVVTTAGLAGLIAAFRELGLLGSGFVTHAPGLFATLALFAALLLVVMGPLSIRNDLRQDLLHLDILRTLPLRGPSLVFAEIASSALALTVIQWGLLTAAYVLFAWAPPAADADLPAMFDATVIDRATLLVIALAAFPIINCASFFVQNAAALLFPAWIRLGATGIGGLEVIGQRILGMGASLLGMAVMLTPPVTAAVTVALLRMDEDMFTAWPLIDGFVAGALCAMLELFVAIRWLGGRFERTDASALLP